MSNTIDTLDDREAIILEAIILNYINKLEPVSSRRLSKSLDLNLSPATIRNIMADLEEGGFLTQPHTSAGRIPTDQAYRYFVQNIGQDSFELSHAEQQRIQRQFSSSFREEDLIQVVPKIINKLSSYVGVSLISNASNLLLKQINFIRVDSTKILSIIVTKSGSIYQKILDIEDDIDQEGLNNISNFVNSSFNGLTIEQIRDKITELMDQERILYDILLHRSLIFSKQAFDDVDNNQGSDSIFFEGAMTIFDLPELADVAKIKNIVEAFFEKKRLVNLLNELLNNDGVSVCIGSESNVQNLMDLSFIISPYKKGSQTVGGLGIIGPKRMPYERMIALIDYLSKMVSALLTSREVVSIE